MSDANRVIVEVRRLVASDKLDVARFTLWKHRRRPRSDRHSLDAD